MTLDIIESLKADINSKERDLQNIEKRCAEYLRKEKDLNEKISDYRKRLSYSRLNDYNKKLLDHDLQRCERELNDITRRHMEDERERSRISRDIQNLRQRLNLEYDEKVRIEKKRVSRQKEREQAEKHADEVWASLSNTANTRQQNREEWQAFKNTYHSLSRKSNPIKKLGVVIAAIAFVLLVLGFISESKNYTNSEQNQNTAKKLEPSSMSMIDYMGLEVSDIEQMYGDDYTTGWTTAGGYGIFYSDENRCPLIFLYREANQTQPDSNEEAPNRTDIICGVICGSDGIEVAKNAKLGMEHRDFEAAIGSIYTTELDTGIGFDLPYAIVEFKGRGANQVDSKNYSLFLLEEDYIVTYAELIEQ